MFDVGKIGAGADQAVIEFGVSECFADCDRAHGKLFRLFQLPVVQVLQAVHRGQLARVRRTDRGAVLDLFQLLEQCLSGDDRARAKPGEAEDLGETVQVDEGIAPVGIGEKVVRQRFDVDEITIGLVDDQRDAMFPRQVEESPNAFGAVDRTARVVGRDQQHRPGARTDQAARFFRVRHCGLGVERQVARHDRAGREPHLVVEIAR